MTTIEHHNRDLFLASNTKIGNDDRCAAPCRSASQRMAAGAKGIFVMVVMVFVCCAIYPLSSRAEPISEPRQFRQLLNDIYGRLTQAPVSNDYFSINDIFRVTCNDFNGERSLEGEILREESNQKAKISGLELRGGYNTEPLAEGTDDEGSLERGRGNLELSWDILKQGYRQNRLRAKAQAYKARQEDLRHELVLLTERNRCRSYGVAKMFGPMLIRLLQLKLQLMEPVYRVERRAYFKHWSFLDDYMISEQDLLLTKHELNILLSDPYYDNGPVMQSSPPILDVDLAVLIASVRADNRFEEIFSAEKESLKMEHAADIRDSLRLYVRKDFDIGGDDQSQDDIIAGVRFRVPLYLRKNNVVQLKIDRAERDKKSILRERIARIRNAHAALQEQLQRTIRQQYRQARSNERLRRTLLQLRNDNDWPITTAITRMRTAIEARIELVRAKAELYRRISDMFLVAQIPFDAELIQVVPLRPDRVRGRYGKRSIYIWSDTFNKLENRDLFAFLEAKQISSVLLSAGQKTKEVKLDQFLHQHADKSMSVELIVGDNSWIFTENHRKAIARSVLAAERTGHLHLDIEPQAMPGYEKHRQTYLSLYVKLLKEIKSALMDRTLSIAVPFHWPEEIYEELSGVADKLCVMVYGTDNVEVLIRRMLPILKTVPADKIVVALRADDYKDEWAIEQTIERIVAETEIDRFAIHALGSFIKKTASLYEIEN